MGHSSRSSNKNPYRNGHFGSNHYQRRGFFGNLMNVFGSGSSGGHHPHNNYPGPNPNYPDYPNNPNYPTNQPHYPNQPGHPHPPGQQNPATPNSGLSCSKCNCQIPIGSKFCLQCGEKVNEGSFCVECGEKLPPNAKFCSKCGAKLMG